MEGVVGRSNVVPEIFRTFAVAGAESVERAKQGRDFVCFVRQRNLTDIALAEAWVTGAKPTRTDRSTWWKVLAEEGSIVQLNPKKSVIRKGGARVIKRAVPTSKHLNSRRHPDSVDWRPRRVAVLSGWGRTGAMEGEDRVTETHASE